jgi:hypothetical protein
MAMDDHIGGQLTRLLAWLCSARGIGAGCHPPHRLSAAQKLTEKKFLAEISLLAEELVA